MGYTRVFDNIPKHKELVKLIKEGYSNGSIARYFGVDITTVRHHAKKLGLPSHRKLKLNTPETYTTCLKCKIEYQGDGSFCEDCANSLGIL